MTLSLAVSVIRHAIIKNDLFCDYMTPKETLQHQSDLDRAGSPWSSLSAPGETIGK